MALSRNRVVKVTDVQVQWMGDKIKGLKRRAAVEGLREGAEAIKNAAVDMIPVETSVLKGTAYADVDPNTLISIAGVDDARDIKAIKQHEDLSYNHPRGGQAKFLEKAVKAAEGGAMGNLAAQISRALS